MGFWTSDTIRTRAPEEELIQPFDAERVVNGAYELSLGAEVYVTSEEKNTKRLLEPGEQLTIPPGQFANLLTDETVSVPPDALGLISVRFRLKQRGLVNVSGFHVDPGYSSPLLFSVYNAGPQPVVIARGEPAFLLWYASFEGVTAEQDLYTGTRDGITSEDVMRLQGEIATPQSLAQRVDALERRHNMWLSVWSVAWKGALSLLVVSAITALIALITGAFD